jgi:hypothetical protein
VEAALSFGASLAPFNIFNFQGIVTDFWVRSKVLNAGLCTFDLSVLDQVAIFVPQLEYRIERVVFWVSHKNPLRRYIIEHLVMESSSDKGFPRFGAIYILHVKVVSLGQLFLNLGPASSDVVYVHLVPDEAERLRWNEFNVLQLVNWIQWILWGPFSLKFHAIWLRSFNVCISKTSRSSPVET